MDIKPTGLATFGTFADTTHTLGPLVGANLPKQRIVRMIHCNYTLEINYEADSAHNT